MTEQMVTLTEWVRTHEVSKRSAMRWVTSNQLRGAVKDERGFWQVPADVVPPQRRPPGRPRRNTP